MFRGFLLHLLGFLSAVLVGAYFAHIMGFAEALSPVSSIGASGAITREDIGGLVALGLIFAIVAAVWVLLMRLLLGLKTISIAWIIATMISLAMIGYPLLQRT